MLSHVCRTYLLLLLLLLHCRGVLPLPLSTTVRGGHRECGTCAVQEGG